MAQDYSDIAEDLELGAIRDPASRADAATPTPPKPKARNDRDDDRDLPLPREITAATATRPWCPAIETDITPGDEEGGSAPRSGLSHRRVLL